MIHGRALRTVKIPTEGLQLDGDLTLVLRSSGLVVFAHGSGSSRHSPRNRAVAAALHDAGLSTLLFDLLTSEEERAERFTAHLRFDIPLLATRLAGALEWVRTDPRTGVLRTGCFGASTGAAAALVAAAQRPDQIAAIVSRGGRPDLARDALPAVLAPTLLIVGEHDQEVLALNREAMTRMRAPVALEIIPGATHLFEEPGTLEQVAGHAARWFIRHLDSHGI